MQGRRVPDDTKPWEYEPGDYGLWNGQWMVAVPSGQPGGGRIGLHEVTEHDDGTITVSPSILVHPSPNAESPTPGYEGWHGYLERGVWREC